MAEWVTTLFGAKIIFNKRLSVIDCVVRNMSPSGAKLHLADLLHVPNEFELYIPKKGCSYRARLLRRDSQGIYVELNPA
jgi:hypothetical protein